MVVGNRRGLPLFYMDFEKQTVLLVHKISSAITKNQLCRFRVQVFLFCGFVFETIINSLLDEK